MDTLKPLKYFYTTQDYKTQLPYMINKLISTIYGVLFLVYQIGEVIILFPSDSVISI